VFAKHDDPYAGADLDNARRIVALLWLLSTLLVLAFLPFDPPVEAIGRAGWAVLAVIALAGLAVPLAILRRRHRASFDALLAYAYLGLAQVALLEWLAGGRGSAYQGLFLLWVGTGAGVHPARRGLPFLVITPLVAALPLLYGGWSPALASEIVTAAMMWCVLGAVIMALMTYIRAQRVGLAEESRLAQDLARADELTGLGNRRAFQEALEVEITRTRRADSSLSVAILDIDHFKQINDGHGHLKGDDCLRNLADVFKRAMRAGDRCFRWGGDEFAVLLPDTSYEQAQHVLERLAAMVATTCVRPDGGGLSVSCGVAQLDGPQSVDELLGYADLALMARKSAKGVERA